MDDFVKQAILRIDAMLARHDERFEKAEEVRQSSSDRTNALINELDRNQARIAETLKSLDRFDKLINGNGKDGLDTRISLIEKDIVERAKQIERQSQEREETLKGETKKLQTQLDEQTGWKRHMKLTAPASLMVAIIMVVFSYFFYKGTAATPSPVINDQVQTLMDQVQELKKAVDALTPKKSESSTTPIAPRPAARRPQPPLMLLEKRDWTADRLLPLYGSARSASKERGL